MHSGRMMGALIVHVRLFTAFDFPTQPLHQGKYSTLDTPHSGGDLVAQYGELSPGIIPFKCGDHRPIFITQYFIP